MSSAAAKRKAWRFTAPSVLPGFAPAFGYTLLYLSLIVLLPLSALVLRASELGFGGLFKIATEPRVAAGLWTSFSISLAALLDAAIDLPFALPTAVAGISLAAL